MNISDPSKRKHVTPEELRQLRERLQRYHGVDIAILGDAEGLSEGEITAELESIRRANRGATMESYRRILPIAAVAALAAIAVVAYPHEPQNSQSFAVADIPASASTLRKANTPLADLDTITIDRANPQTHDAAVGKESSEHMTRQAARPPAVASNASTDQGAQTSQSANSVVGVPTLPNTVSRAVPAPAGGLRTTYDVAVPYDAGDTTGATGSTADGAGANSDADAAAAALANAGAPGATPPAAAPATDTASTPATGTDVAPTTPSVTIVMPLTSAFVSGSMSGTRFRRVSSIGTPMPHGTLPFHARIRRR